MKKKLFLALILITITNIGFAQFKLNEWVDQIKFDVPDTNNWIQISKFPAQMLLKGSIQFKHIPIVDSKGYSIEPAINLLYQEITDSIDVIEFSVNLLGCGPFPLRHELLGGYPEYSSDKNSVVFNGEYTNKGVKHKVVIGYILHNNIGIEIIGDATEDVFPQVESEIRKFIKSVILEE